MTWLLISLSADKSQSCSSSVSPNLSWCPAQGDQGLLPDLPAAEPGQPLGLTSRAAAHVPVLVPGVPDPAPATPVQTHTGNNFAPTHQKPKERGTTEHKHQRFLKSAAIQHMCQALAGKLNRTTKEPKLQTLKEL